MILPRMLLLIALALPAPPARAADAAPAPDAVLRHLLTLQGKQIPLPAGEWLVAGSALATKDLAGGTLPAPVASLVLFRVDAAAVTAFVTVHVNSLPARRGWGTAEVCGHPAPAVVAREPGADGEVSCSFVVAVAAPAAPRQTSSSSPAWTQARALAAARGWRLPERWLMAGAREGDREDVVDVRYHFDPQGWDGPVSAGAAVPAAFVAALIRWRPAMAAAVEAGLKNRLEADFTLPWPDAAPGGLAAESGSRADALAALLAEGWLTPAQYKEQLALPAEPGGDPADDTPAVMGMLAVKTVGWRAIVALSVALLSYAFTSSAAIAGGITIATAVVNGGLYFGHELLWRAFDRTPVPASQTIEFAGAGLTTGIAR